MYLYALESDQLYKWSDEYRKRAYRCLEKTSPSAFAPVAPAQVNPARLADRALQALRQARVQMCRGPRPWPQVLSFGEPPGLAATNGLCVAGGARSSCGVRRQLPPSSRGLRSDFRDQPRTPAPPRGALNGRHERSCFRPACIHRCWVGRRAPRQHGRSLAGWQSRHECGGSE
jgi:hypothetical protein